MIHDLADPGGVRGREQAQRLLRDAGFANIEVVRPPLDPINLLFACRT